MAKFLVSNSCLYLIVYYYVYNSVPILSFIWIDEDLNRRQREILKLLDLADIISPGINCVIYLSFTQFTWRNIITLITGLTRLQGILLYNLAAVDYTAIEKELDFFNYIVPPNVTVHACLEVNFKINFISKISLTFFYCYPSGSNIICRRFARSFHGVPRRLSTKSTFWPE